jgi:hypothetical protein
LVAREGGGVDITKEAKGGGKWPVTAESRRERDEGRDGVSNENEPADFQGQSSTVAHGGYRSTEAK